MWQSSPFCKLLNLVSVIEEKSSAVVEYLRPADVPAPPLGSSPHQACMKDVRQLVFLAGGKCWWDPAPVWLLG